MAIICRDHRLLFIMAPRTGCSTVGWVLQQRLGGEFLPPTDLYGADGTLRVPHKHSTLPQLTEAGLVMPELRRTLLVVSAVRNPFDSLVSLYVKNAKTYRALLDKPGSFVHDRQAKQEAIRFCATHTFDEWIEHVYGPRLSDRLLGRGVRERRNKHVIGADLVMRFESLQADFDALLRRVGIDEPIGLPRMNRTRERRRDYRSYYSPRARQLVDKAWRSDLDQFGYAF